MLFISSHAPGYHLITRRCSCNIGLDPVVIEVGYNNVPPSRNTIFKRDVYILHYIESGRGIYQGQKLHENTGYLVVPDEREFIRADEKDPYVSYWIRFEGRHARDILHNCNLPHHNGVFPFFRSKECIKIIKSALFTDYKNPIEEAYALQSVLFKLISIHTADTDTASSSTDSVAQIVAKYIENNYFSQIKINDIASNFHITRNYMYVLFKQEFGCSPQEYLNEQRIGKAKQLLKNKEPYFSVKEISNALGYENQIHFSRFFRTQTGISPSDYRKKHHM